MRLGVVLLLGMAPSAQAQVTTRDSAGVRIVQSAPSRDTAVVVSRVPVRLINDPTVLGPDARVTGALMTRDGTLWIAEAAKPRLWKFPVAGGKSSVYDWTSLYALLRVGSDSMLVWDGASQARLLDHSGKQLENYAVRTPRDVRRANGTVGRPALSIHGRLRDGALLGSLRDTYRDARTSHVASDSARIVVVDRKGTITVADTVHWLQRVMYRGTSTGMDAPLPFGPTGAIAATPDGYLHSDGSRFALREHGKDGSLIRIIRLARPLPVLTPAEIARFKAARLATIPAAQRADYAAGLAWLPWPTRKGGWTALHRDAAGRVWARQWSADDEDAIWDLFTPSGRHLGVATVPAGVTVLDIGKDHLIGVVAGVRGPEVRVYAVRGEG